MRKISLWAKHHRPQAVGFLVLLKLTLALLAFYLGSSLADVNIKLSFSVFFVALVVLLIAAILYPTGKKRSNVSGNVFYKWQKSCDFIVAASSFTMIVTLANTNFATPINSAVNAATVIASPDPTAEEILASLKHRDKSTLTKKEKRILKDEFKKQVKVYAVAKLKGHTSDAAKAGLIVLTIIGALGLLYLVAALACSLSCNGSDAAAVIVGILGLALVVWGSVALIRRIVRGPKQKRHRQQPINLHNNTGE